MNLECSSDAFLALVEREDEMVGIMASEYRARRGGFAPWRTVPFARIERIWKSAVAEGFVRDEKGLLGIEERFVENVLRLAVNTRVAGHTHLPSFDGLGDHLEEEEFEGFVEWAIGTEGGHWRISDYGLQPLYDLAALATETDNPVRKLAVLDRMLNVMHQRSDLASWFVEGGSRALSCLSEGVRPSERALSTPGP